MLLQILDTWSLRLHVESNKTPRFLGGSLLGVMRESPVFVTIFWFWLVLLWVVITISSVLSSFSFKRLLSSISLYPWYRAQDKILLSPLILIHLVGRKYATEYHQHKDESSTHVFQYSPRWVVYIVNKIGPSTEPWGTPYLNVISVDVHDPIWTVCVWSLRYDSNHLRSTPLIPKDWFNKFNNFWWSMQHLNQAVLKWLLPHCQRLGEGHFVHEGVLSLCCEVVCKQTEISHISCWFSNALLIEHKQRLPQALKWKID